MNTTVTSGSIDSRRAAGPSRILACAVASVTLMWLLSYAALLIGHSVLGELLFACAVLALAGGGAVAGRPDPAIDHPDAGLAASGVRGLAVGTAAALFNLLVIASLLHSEVADAGGWVTGILLGCIVVGGIGGLVGGMRQSWESDGNWLTLLCWSVTGLTFFMIISGGIVTGFEAGLAVPDWPGSYGHNMLLYPLTEMVADPTHGVFFEHAHRLTGMFVGLTAIVLCVMLWVGDRRIGVGMLGTIVLLLVVSQGVLGGLRVTGVGALGEEYVPPAPSLTLAMVHGVVAQVVLALMALTATVTSTRWRTGPVSAGGGSLKLDRPLTIVVMAVLLVQLAVGAVYRHLATELGPRDSAAMQTLIAHILLALGLAIVGVIVGLRAAGIEGRDPVLRRIGAILLASIGLQILLGIAAMAVVLIRPEQGTTADVPTLEVLVTSAHQANGAIMLVAVALLAAWYGHSRAPQGISDSSSASTA